MKLVAIDITPKQTYANAVNIADIFNEIAMILTKILIDSQDAEDLEHTCEFRH